MRPPIKVIADSLKCYDTLAEFDGCWYLARPIAVEDIQQRFKLAWAVFTGKADALFWTKQ